ncbi:MAG: hypothetical protein WC667_01240 [Sulfurimonas sp.]
MVSTNLGQSFTLPSPATVTDIVLYEGTVTGNGSDTYSLYSSANCSGGALTTLTMTWANSVNSAMTGTLVAPQSLAAGTYSFCKTSNNNAFSIRVDTSAPTYAGGDLIDTGAPQVGLDLTFQVLGTVNAAAPLSPKGYIALALSFLGLAWYGNRRRTLNANHL